MIKKTEIPSRDILQFLIIYVKLNIVLFIVITINILNGF